MTTSPQASPDLNSLLVTLKCPPHQNFPQNPAPQLTINCDQSVFQQIHHFICEELRYSIQGKLRIIYRGRILSRNETLNDSPDNSLPHPGGVVMHICADYFTPLDSTPNALRTDEAQTIDPTHEHLQELRHRRTAQPSEHIPQQPHVPPPDAAPQRVQRLVEAPRAAPNNMLTTLLKIAAMAFLMTYSSGDVIKWLKYTLFFAIAFVLYHVIAQPSSVHRVPQHENLYTPHGALQVGLYALGLFFLSLNPSFTPTPIPYELQNAQPTADQAQEHAHED